MQERNGQPQAQPTPGNPAWLASQQQDHARIEPWPEGVVARYLTVAGATVDLTYRLTVTNPPEPFATLAACHGCPASEEFNHWHLVRGMTVDREERDSDAADSGARDWAQDHAAECRALPRPPQ